MKPEIEKIISYIGTSKKKMRKSEKKNVDSQFKKMLTILRVTQLVLIFDLIDFKDFKLIT